MAQTATVVFWGEIDLCSKSGAIALHCNDHRYPAFSALRDAGPSQTN